MGFLRNAAVAVGVLAAGLMYKPEVVLLLPNGFIPYAILGNLPPAYFSYDAWKEPEFSTWAKDGDLVVAVGGKCGTNWLLYMSHLIRVGGDVEKYPFEEVNLNTPWPSIKHYPGQKWPQIKEKMMTGTLPDGSSIREKWDHPEYPFRIFKSHEMPEGSADNIPSAVLPVRTRRKMKFLAAVRNPWDQLRSLYPFFKNHKAEFRRTWGDFPPVYDNKESMLKDFTDGGPLEPLAWSYPKVWWGYRNDPNVLLLSYEDMVEDHEASIRQLAAFLEVALTEEQVAKITHLTSFAEMKKIADRFDYMLWAHPTKPAFTVMESGKLLRSGKRGEGKDFFSEEQNQKIREHVDKHFEPELQAFMGISK
jgi:hypothetical protein